MHAGKRLDEALAELEETGVPPVAVAVGLLAEWETLPARARRDMLVLLVARVVVVRGAKRGDVRVVVEPR